MASKLADRLGVVASAFGADVRAVPRLARVAGFRGVLFDAYSSEIQIPDLGVTGFREFNRMLAAEDQRLFGLRIDIGTKGFAPGSDVDRALDRIEKVISAARALASPLVCVDIGTLPHIQAAAEAPKPPITPEMAGLIILPEPPRAPTGRATNASRPVDTAFVAQVESGMSELGRRADRFGVNIAFSSPLSDFTSLAAAIAAARCPWFGFDLDPVAILQDTLTRDEIFSMVGPLIRHVRARDASVSGDRRVKPVPIGRGDANFPELLALLDGAGYAGFVTVDPTELADRSAAAAAARNYLAGLSS